MSLVYEALQKAEREKERKVGTAPPAPAPVPAAPAKVLPQPTATVPPAPAKRNYLNVFIVCSSLLGLAAMLYVMIVVTKRTTDVPPPPVTSAPPPVAPETVVPAAPTTIAQPPATENDSRFKLTGIMKIGEKYGAVINGHVVYDGNYVEGAVVEKVERDRVTLDWNGRRIVVRLS